MDQLAKLVLLTTNLYFIISVIILGYFSKFRSVFSRATILVLFSIILNAYLKSIWKVPLDPILGKEGWAFPSGHMQSFIVFYGYLVWRMHNIIMFGLLVIGAHLVAFGLVNFNYHNYYDILAATYFGLITILIFQIIYHQFEAKYQKLVSVVIVVLLAILLFKIPKISSHILPAASSLTGFSLGWNMNNNDKVTIKKYLVNIILAFVGVVTIYYASNYLNTHLNYKMLICLKYFLIGLWISYGTDYLSNKISITR